MREETGWTVERLTLACSFYLSPSASTERIHLFLGLFDASQPPDGVGLEHEGENIQLFVVPFDEAWAMLEQGVLDAATAILAVQWLALRRAELRGFIAG
ncbi:MAG: NUDIX hydrolase [Magnetococcales bacterium]|nr:NUDIX hydrolase [Magnetococcales bacterium]